MAKKLFLIIGVLIVLLGIPTAIFVLKQKTAFKLGAQTSNEIENLQITNITEQEASILWTTKNPTQGMINYGLSPNNLTLIQPENTPTVNHKINLTNLLPASNYFFVIKIGDKIFDNQGQPYTFTTKPKISPCPTEVASLSEEGFLKAMGTNDSTYDLNKDGVVNISDLLLFRQCSQ